jgi:hypothetical protein
MGASRSPKLIASEFVKIDIHDDTVESFSILPAKNKRESAKIEIVLFRYWKKRRRLLQFSNCANIIFSADADVLLGNAPCNTRGQVATADVNEIKKIMELQKRSWNVTYQRSIDPLGPKLKLAKNYTLFRVEFFGGTLEVVAKSYKLKNLK